MEGIHGIDVSWLHSSNRDKPQLHSTPTLHPKDSPSMKSLNPPPPAPLLPPPPPPPNTQRHDSPARREDQQPSPSPPVANGKVTTRRPALLGRPSLEKLAAHAAAAADPNKPPSRRNSWISSLSAKFSSAQNAQATTPTQGAHGQKTQSNGVQPHSPSPPPAISVTSSAPGTLQSVQEEPLEPYIPQPPKSGPTAFFSNALRRLSSNNQSASIGKVIPNGGMCPRRVMNIDTNRERCLIPELEPAKLRRVAFCVDVEIAGAPRYKDEVEKKSKSKDKKLKERGEGEALKNPDGVLEEKERNGIVRISNEIVGTENAPNPEGTIIDEDSKASKKKEKKKRSEAERKERKEKKRRRAEENGSVPLEITRDEDSSRAGSPAGGEAAPKPQDRPTTDPVRIYRRCCQLRETPILKRIVDQLSPASTAETPGVVTCLDLTGSRLQHNDIVTLGDWLAIVPVKRVVLENADLTDEGVRVILAGLYAAKAPDYPRRRHYSPPIRDSGSHEPIKVEERSGVVERLSLKNNPKITKDGWKTVSLFVNMCRSLKALDVSMIPFPQIPQTPLRRASQGAADQNMPSKNNKLEDPADILSKAFAERLAGSHLEELIMSECFLSTQNIRKIIDGVTVSGLRRLGLAGNCINEEGLEHVLRYIRSGVCQGLDLGGNDLHLLLGRLAEGLTPDCPIWALSLADCNLTPESLKPLFPALVALPDLRFIDLSHNKELFSSDPSALGYLRKYIPLLRALKRIHLLDVSMSPAQAIGLAEVLPDNPGLAQINILENPQISALSTAEDEASQEEACALYASLMAAVRVSDSIISIDVDVPGEKASEVVKALSKQVVAYSLRNLERCTPLLDTFDYSEVVPQAVEGEVTERTVQVPEVLLHLVGHSEGQDDSHDDDDPAPDNDYIVGGTGVVKALNYCLLEKTSQEPSTPNGLIQEEGTAKARVMSKNLLESARKIRMRLRPALVKEARVGDDAAYRRLLFLDQTLQGMIQRFEDAYPDCRLPEKSQISSTPSEAVANNATQLSSLSNETTNLDLPQDAEISDPEDTNKRMPLRSRHNSDVSLASRALSIEEGHIHRIGQSIRRDILRPQSMSAHSPALANSIPPTPKAEKTPDPIKFYDTLRQRLDSLSGDELKKEVEKEGWEETMKRLVENRAELERLEKENPEEWNGFRDAQLAALVNAGQQATPQTQNKDNDDVAVLEC